ncbi:hypothetical protein GGX14DRAFT_576161 [Mycena pura]|uniref:TEA domain-containing protein n=1 Tax=Mycena pura TaxID=153505 RepID=A0AAD6Y1I1_9AGAR|nr:hypothetical protein GGX14DRAFT_576161 [Mycena pura]
MADPLPNSMLDIPTDNSCLQGVMRPEHKPHCVLSTVEEMGVHLTTEFDEPVQEQTAIRKMHSLTKRTIFRSVGDTRVWHPAVESSLIRGFITYEEIFGDYERSKGFKKRARRNQFISTFIMEETKAARTPKQIDSRLGEFLGRMTRSHAYSISGELGYYPINGEGYYSTH